MSVRVTVLEDEKAIKIAGLDDLFTEFARVFAGRPAATTSEPPAPTNGKPDEEEPMPVSEWRRRCNDVCRRLGSDECAARLAKEGYAKSLQVPESDRRRMMKILEA